MEKEFFERFPLGAYLKNAKVSKRAYQELSKMRTNMLFGEFKGKFIRDVGFVSALIASGLSFRFEKSIRTCLQQSE